MLSHGIGLTFFYKYFSEAAYAGLLLLGSLLSGFHTFQGKFSLYKWMTSFLSNISAPIVKDLWNAFCSFLNKIPYSIILSYFGSIV